MCPLGYMRMMGVVPPPPLFHSFRLRDDLPVWAGHHSRSVSIPLRGETTDGQASPHQPPATIARTVGRRRAGGPRWETQKAARAHRAVGGPPGEGPHRDTSTAREKGRREIEYPPPSPPRVTRATDDGAQGRVRWPM